MREWALGTGLIDCVIAITVLEGFVLLLYRRITGKGVKPSDFGINLVAGLLLMLALRSHLAAAAWGWTAMCLAAAGVAHATDIWSRWNR